MVTYKAKLMRMGDGKGIYVPAAFLKHGLIKPDDEGFVEVEIKGL